uniref:Apocytochrome b n=1 Tax=Tetrahymena rostrata TaxID=5909 RepID=A0A6G5NKU7_TETRO|nr:apocytochromme b [Tetrahymena rostrata]QBI37943.1 apocytochrome b [Tetrahymena rostrata]URP31135.1 apocytochromme b [Tetrahymena rostrata]
MEWNKGIYISTNIKKIIQYFAVMTVSFHDINSLFGFFTFLTIASQLVSGTMLAFSLVPEPMLIPMVREEEDVEDLYTDDFFWLHERGVDMLFIFSYFHLFRKIYLNNFEYEQEAAWKSGVFTFLLFQVVVFLGLVLCCTHLSDITLAIAANLYDTFFAGKGKFYWWIFTSKELNTDTIIRLAYLHYVLAFFLSYLGLIHGVDIHYDWKNESSYDGIDTEMIWFDEALSNELGGMIEIILIVMIVCFIVYPEPEALSYEYFMWGDIGFINDVRFLSVAPHWYFRPFMAWLTVCPFHKIGLFGLIYYFFILFYQPVIHGTNEQNNYSRKNVAITSFIIKRSDILTPKYHSVEDNILHQITFWLFLCSALYVTSYLPYGRFYNRINGNFGTLWSFMYLFIYLGNSFLRRFLITELFFYSTFVKSKFLKENN